MCVYFSYGKTNRMYNLTNCKSRIVGFFCLLCWFVLNAEFCFQELYTNGAELFLLCLSLPSVSQNLRISVLQNLSFLLPVFKLWGSCTENKLFLLETFLWLQYEMLLQENPSLLEQTKVHSKWHTNNIVYFSTYLGFIC